MYKIIKQTYLGKVSETIQKYNDDGSSTSIPMVEDNSDYQIYLQWVNQGNQPEPADE